MDQSTRKEYHVPEALVMDAIRRLNRSVKRHYTCIERRLDEAGIPNNQHHLLMHLARYERIPCQKELAEALCLSPAAVATSLKQLEKDGYITRTVTEDDNRRNDIRITDMGYARIEECRSIYKAVDSEMFAGFTDEEMEVFIAMIARLDRNLDAAGAPTCVCQKKQS